MKKTIEVTQCDKCGKTIKDFPKPKVVDKDHESYFYQVYKDPKLFTIQIRYSELFGKKEPKEPNVEVETREADLCIRCIVELLVNASYYYATFDFPQYEPFLIDNP